MKLKKKHKTFLGVFVSALVVIALYIGFRTWLYKLPPEFREARQNAAEVSQNIVTFTTETDEKIKAVNISDLRGNVVEANKLIKEAKEKNTEAYKQAFELSRNLEILARSLDNIPSRRNQRLAYEAVAVELSLVSEFILYTSYLDKFLDNLKEAIISDSSQDRKSAEYFLDQTNNQARKVNSLNSEFISKITEFSKPF